MNKLISCCVVATVIAALLVFAAPLAAQDHNASDLLMVQAQDSQGHPHFLVRNNGAQTVVVQVSIERVGLMVVASRLAPAPRIAPFTLMLAPWEEREIELAESDGNMSSREYLVRLQQLPILYSAPGSRGQRQEMDLSVLSMSFTFRPENAVIFADAGAGGR